MPSSPDVGHAARQGARLASYETPSEVAALPRVFCLCVQTLVDVFSDRVGTSLRGKWVPRVRDPLDNALAIAAALCSDDPATSQIMAPNLGDVLSMLTRYCCRAIMGGARMMLCFLLMVYLRLRLHCCFFVCPCALVPCAIVPCAMCHCAMCLRLARCVHVRLSQWRGGAGSINNCNGF